MKKLICGHSESKFRKNWSLLMQRRDKGQVWRSLGNSIPKQVLNGTLPDGWNYSWINKCINAIREKSAIHFYLFRNEADSFNSMLQLTKKYVYTYFKFTWRFLFQQLGLFLLGLTQNSSCQEWTTLDKKDSFKDSPSMS